MADTKRDALAEVEILIPVPRYLRGSLRDTLSSIMHHLAEDSLGRRVRASGGDSPRRAPGGVMTDYLADLAQRVRAHCIRTWAAVARRRVVEILTQWERADG